MGLRSGEYAGRKRICAPRCVMSDSVGSLLCGQRLSMISRPQRRTQHTTHISLEDFSIGSTFNRHASNGTIQPDRTDHSGGVPMTVRGLGVDTLAFGRASAQTSHIGLGARLVQKDQPGWVEAGLAPPPEPARPCDVRSVLLTGPECLFLYVSPIFWSA